ncbi:hypothetical protein BKA56DRAFT_614347 [Ilyonectria sp. MPI-CAGE-AT-0026]|nr:hypothetical protein BKA56DRAFT_614347 [Ilyonectria sp. MPI-CAGE-AT-0026]
MEGTEVLFPSSKPSSTPSLISLVISFRLVKRSPSQQRPQAPATNSRTNSRINSRIIPSVGVRQGRFPLESAGPWLLPCPRRFSVNPCPRRLCLSQNNDLGPTCNTQSHTHTNVFMLAATTLPSFVLPIPILLAALVLVNLQGP